MELRSFQEKAVTKLTPEASVIIGDDMGLGKTVEGIALDMRRRDALPPSTIRARTLIICPLSVIANWQEHLAEWNPGARVTTIDRKDRSSFIKAVHNGNYDYYIMHWDALRLADMQDLPRYNWFHIIADEAHRASNREAQVTVCAKRLKHRYLTLLTGTPCTSKPDQFWSLLNWAKPKVFTSYWQFFNHHVVFKAHSAGGVCLACFGQHKSAYRELVGVAHEDELLQKIEPYYVRRLKQQVAPELPDKYYTKVTVELGPQQRRVYNQMRDEMLAWIGEHEDQPLPAPVAIAKLVRLLQLAGAYATIEQIKKRKINPEWEYAQKLEADSSTSLERLAMYKDVEKYVEVVEEKVTLSEPSSKLDAVMEILAANPERQFVIFSQSKQLVKLLAFRLKKAGISHGLLTGDTDQADRGNMVAAFQAGKFQVFAGTIQAGGEGITLTAATTCIFIDRTWSPAKNLQAEDRLHRIGQENAVQIIDIVAKDTVDGGRLQRLETSWTFIRQILGDK